MTWNSFWAVVWQFIVSNQALVGALVGAVMRTILPWLISWLEQMSKDGQYIKPQFNVKYLASLGLAILGFAVAFLTLPGLFVEFRTWEFIPAVGLAYSGQDIGRTVLKGANAAVAWVRNGR